MIDKNFLVNILVSNIDYIKCENCRGHNCNEKDIKACMQSHWGLSYEAAGKIADKIIRELNDN